MGERVRHRYLEPAEIVGSFVVFDKYYYEMTESVFHHLTLYSLTSLGHTPLPYKVTLGIPTPYKEVCTE